METENQIALPTMDELNRIMTNLTALTDRWIRSQGINPTVFAILYCVHYYPGCTQSDICDIWKLPKQTVSTQCNELMDQGLLDITQDNANRRRKILTLTEQGIQYAQPLVEALRNAETTAFSVIGDEMAKTLLKGATEFYTAYENALGMRKG